MFDIITLAKPPIDLSQIRPAAPSPESDKFSRNIYNWFRAKGKRYGFGVWCEQRNIITDKHDPFTYQNARRGDIYFGFRDGDFVIGAKMRAVQVGDNETACWVGTRKAIEITDWFWSEYLKRGRCLLNDHDMGLLYDRGRFTVNGETRTCNWCGAVQHRHVRTITRERIEWH